MNQTTTVPKTPETKLRGQLPEPLAVRGMLFENRRERCLLRQLLKLSERIYASDQSTIEKDA